MLELIVDVIILLMILRAANKRTIFHRIQQLYRQRLLISCIKVAAAAINRGIAFAIGWPDDIIVVVVISETAIERLHRILSPRFSAI